MISATSTTFKFIDRGEGQTLVLLPGWATDHRIFRSLRLKFNYLVPDSPSSSIRHDSLLDTLQEHNLRTVSILGWSQGGLWASRFAGQYSDLIDELILVGIRGIYGRQETERLKTSLLKNKRAALYKFYSQCFHDRHLWLDFKTALFDAYARELTLETLIEGLDELSSVPIDPAALTNVKRVTIVHGARDAIAPPAQARAIAERLPRARFILLDDTGHMPFLKDGFPEYLDA